MYPSNVWHIIWKLLISSNYRFHFYSFMAHAYYQYKYHWPELGDKKPPIFVFNLFYIACIEWTDYCTTGNGGKSTAHVVPALIRVCGLSGGSRGGARGAQPPLIFRPKWGPKGRKKIFFEAGVPPPLSQDLDPPMGFSVSFSVWFHVVLFPFCPSENISTTSTSDDQRSKWIRFIQVFVYFYLCVYI